ncbi:Aldose 1-epimerase precursor [Aquimixticola soesokkakensis]|uniref:Aldose 1-epimerase n=1 Tax=Aquimixticola soesokkakensis TaxID=1519096 RepID=A0A1Y5TBG5_9RHOB|nr:aldose epimerase family protein [Aquimixticola soesokkakensis]SLN59984.1 Aldose 1-epimerase precursor [Aquimixticola soesokkakensis]
MSRRAGFGTLPDGRAVEAITLEAGQTRVRLLSLGASIQSIVTPDRAGVQDDIVLGHDSLAGYLARRSFFGATIGRVANRIAGGRFCIDGQEHRLAQNEGTTTLHGGPEGFDLRLWAVDAVSDDSVTFSLTSPAGDQGFAGRVAARVTYRLVPRDRSVQLDIDYHATSDAPTPLGLTNHSFFALCGAKALRSRAATALDYHLQVPAARYLVVDDAKVPTGIATVAQTPFDFRSPRQPREAINAGALSGYDHCLCLDGGTTTLDDHISGRRLELETDQEGLQVYTGNVIAGGIAGKDGLSYRPHDAICLEPQSYPNAVNMPASFGARETILRPGVPYRAAIVLRFSTI